MQILRPTMFNYFHINSTLRYLVLMDSSVNIVFFMLGRICLKFGTQVPNNLVVMVSREAFLQFTSNMSRSVVIWLRIHFLWKNLCTSNQPKMLNLTSPHIPYTMKIGRIESIWEVQRNEFNRLSKGIRRKNLL